jgi:hypothetical protein
MHDEKIFPAGLFDFSFQKILSRSIVKLLYVIALVGGGVALVTEVVLQMQQSTATGLLALVFGAIALFVWVLCARVGFEMVLALFRIADNVERATRGER